MSKEKIYIVRESRLHTTALDRQQFYATMMEVAPEEKELIDATQELGQLLEKGLELATSYAQTRRPEEGLAEIHKALEDISKRIVALAEKGGAAEEPKPARKRKTSGSAK